MSAVLSNSADAGSHVLSSASAKSAAILARMQVLDSRGNRIGYVDRLLPTDEIRLMRQHSPDGLHHYIPLDWVAEVDSTVRLNKCCAEIYRDRA